MKVKEDKLVLIGDETYLNCQKKHKKLKLGSFSVQRKKHLVKPFVLWTRDGYIVDIYGLYPAFKKNTVEPRLSKPTICETRDFPS